MSLLFHFDIDLFLIKYNLTLKFLVISSFIQVYNVPCQYCSTEKVSHSNVFVY